MINETVMDAHAAAESVSPSKSGELMGGGHNRDLHAPSISFKRDRPVIAAAGITEVFQITGHDRQRAPLKAAGGGCDSGRHAVTVLSLFQFLLTKP